MKPEQINLARELLKLSQAELAQVLDVHQRTVSKWERGLLKPSHMRTSILRGVLQRADDGKLSRQLGGRIRGALRSGAPMAALSWLLAHVLRRDPQT